MKLLKSGKTVRTGKTKGSGKTVRTGKTKGSGKSAEKGMMTVEATLIVPIILLLLAGIILLFVTIGRREVLRSEMYQALYTLRMEEEKDGNPAAALKERLKYILADAKKSRGQVVCDDDTLGLEGEVEYHGSFPVKTERERDVCSDRLRRWSFYGNLAKGKGD